MLDVICTYVDNQAGDDAFADFVAEAEGAECGSADAGPGLFDRPDAGPHRASPPAGPDQTWDVWPATRFEVFSGGDCDTYWDVTHDPAEAEGWVVVDPSGAVRVLSSREAFASPEDALAAAANLAARGGGRARAWGEFDVGADDDDGGTGDAGAGG